MKSRIAVRILIPVLCLFFVSSAGASSLAVEKKTCPICGQQFEHVEQLSGYVTSMRLDLKPEGMIHAPERLPVCPKCGFIIYSDKIGAQELAEGKMIIASPEYKQLKSRSDWRRMAFLYEKLNKNAADIGYAYLYASWEEEYGDDEKRSKAYYREDLEKSVAHFKAHLEAPQQHDKSWQTMQMLTGELMRLLGQFKDAARHFEGLAKRKEFQGNFSEKIIKFELGLCQHKDASEYTMNEVEDLKGFNCRSKDCSFPDLQLPEDFVVFAAGGSEGRKLDFYIDQSGQLATQMDVDVHFPSQPVVLMLGAYDPVIWNIRRNPKTKIAAVFVSGYHGQAVAGLDTGVPVLNTTYENKGPCGNFQNPNHRTARCLFGRSVNTFYKAENGKVFVGDPIPAGMELITSKTNTPESHRDKTTPLARQINRKDFAGSDTWNRTTPLRLSRIAKQDCPKAGPQRSRSFHALPLSTAKPPRELAEDAVVIVVSGSAPFDVDAEIARLNKNPPGPKIIFDSVQVDIDRPGSKVLLILLSHKKMNWQVSASPATEISGIVASAYDAPPTVSTTMPAKAFLAELPSTYATENVEFIKLLAALNGMFGITKLDAFLGSDFIPLKLAICSLDTDREVLTADWPAPQKHARNIRFDVVTTDYKKDVWSLTGPVEGDGRAYIGDGKVAIPATGGVIYRLQKDGLEIFDPLTGKGAVAKVPKNFPILEWGSDIAYDSKRNIILAATSKFLHRFDAGKKEWLDFRSFDGIDFASLSYDPATDRYVGWSQFGNLIFISGDGQALFVRYVWPKLAGFGRLFSPGNGPAPHLTIVPNGNDIVFLYISGNTIRNIWHYDVEKDTAVLTYKRR
jgi:hypothetical protein